MYCIASTIVVAFETRNQYASPLKAMQYRQAACMRLSLNLVSLRDS